MQVNKTIDSIWRQLSGFSATARLLIVSLVVILALCLLLVATFAGKAELVPLGLNRPGDDNARTQAAAYLDRHSIRWEEGNGDILVPVDERLTVLAALAEESLITTDQIDFRSIVNNDSPFMDRNTRKTQYLVAKMNVVARMISAMKGIEQAEVVIDQPERSGGLGALRIKPTASVIVQTKAERLGQGQADAISRMVAGSHAELTVDNVTIVDARTGRALTARTDDDMVASRYLDMKRAAEKHAKETIEQVLSVIPGVVVAVNAQVDARSEILEQRSYEEPKLGVTREKTQDRNVTNPRPLGEPGVRSNTGVMIGGFANGSELTDNRADTRMVPAFGDSLSRQNDPKGYALKINATVQVPKSYFVNLFRDRNPDAGDDAPDAATLDALVAQETDELKQIVEPLIDTGALANAESGMVVVRMFNDVAAGTAGGVFGPGAAGGGLTGGFLSERLVSMVSLGALAVVSLFLMFMMVRRATREDELPTAEELVGIPPALLDDDMELVGEAEETATALDGVEIDEDSVRRQQMIEQINDLATNASDEAAALVRKWLKTEN